MNIIRIFVKRPVLTTMIVVAFVVLGLYSYQRMVIELMPSVEFPFVIVTTVYPGASPGEVESQITKKVEDAVSTIANVKNLTSYSQENVSQVFIEFQLETDVDIDAIDVKDKVDAIQSNLPENSEKSVISKFDFSAFPVMELAIAAPRPLEEIYGVADKVVKDRLSRISGVASVDITGKRQREIRVEVSPQKLRAYGLSLMDVMGVIAANNLNVPVGHITRGAKEITLRMTGEIAGPRELGDLRLPLRKGGTIPLSEVARIVDGTEELRESSTYNGEPVIGISINKRSDGNTVLVARDVYKALDELKKTLDKDITITITSDTAPFVRAAVSDVLSNVMIGILLTALLLLLFLHNWQQTVVAALSMPISVIATFLLMEQSHFTLNVMSLLALGISIGTLVTNSIVIIENITRFVHLGMDPEEAAVKGTAEVAVAVAASTLTNIVVFTPIAFMSGIIGRFFLQFGLTVVFATVFSIVVSYTIVPMLAARLIKPQAVDRDERATGWGARIEKKWDKFYDDLSGGYRDVLARMLDHRKRWILVTLVIFIGSLFLFRFVGGEFIPRVDQGVVIVTMNLPPGTNLIRAQEVSARVADILRTHREVEGVLVKVGGSQRSVENAQIVAKLVDRSKRKLGVTQFVNVLRPELAGIPDAEIMLSAEGGATGAAEADLIVDVLSSNQRALETAADSVHQIFHRVPGLVEIQTSEKAGKPEIAVMPRRQQAADQGLSAAAIGSSHAGRVRGGQGGRLPGEGRGIRRQGEIRRGRPQGSVLHQGYAASVKHGIVRASLRRRRGDHAFRRIADHAQGQAANDRDHREHRFGLPERGPQGSRPGAREDRAAAGRQGEVRRLRRDSGRIVRLDVHGAHPRDRASVRRDGGDDGELRAPDHDHAHASACAHRRRHGDVPLGHDSEHLLAHVGGHAHRHRREQRHSHARLHVAAAESGNEDQGSAPRSVLDASSPDRYGESCDRRGNDSPDIRGIGRLGAPHAHGSGPDRRGSRFGAADSVHYSDRLYVSRQTYRARAKGAPGSPLTIRTRYWSILFN